MCFYDPVKATCAKHVGADNLPFAIVYAECGYAAARALAKRALASAAIRADCVLLAVRGDGGCHCAGLQYVRVCYDVRQCHHYAPDYTPVCAILGVFSGAPCPYPCRHLLTEWMAAKTDSLISLESVFAAIKRALATLARGPANSQNKKNSGVRAVGKSGGPIATQLGNLWSVLIRPASRAVVDGVFLLWFGNALHSRENSRREGVRERALGGIPCRSKVFPRPFRKSAVGRLFRSIGGSATIRGALLPSLSRRECHDWLTPDGFGGGADCQYPILSAANVV